MINQGDLISIEEFKKVYDVDSNQGIGSWLIDVATTWFFGRSSSLAKVGADTALNGTKISEDAQYIVMKPLKEITMSFIQSAVKNKVSDLDLYFSPSELREQCFPNYNFAQLDLLLRYMHSEEPAFVVKITNSRQGLVCFENSAAKKVCIQQPQSLEKHTGIVQLKETLYILKKQIEGLQIKVDS